MVWLLEKLLEPSTNLFPFSFLLKDFTSVVSAVYLSMSCYMLTTITGLSSLLFAAIHTDAYYRVSPVFGSNRRMRRIRYFAIHAAGFLDLLQRTHNCFSIYELRSPFRSPKICPSEISPFKTATPSTQELIF